MISHSSTVAGAIRFRNSMRSKSRRTHRILGSADLYPNTTTTRQHLQKSPREPFSHTVWPHRTPMGKTHMTTVNQMQTNKRNLFCVSWCRPG